MLGMRGYTPYTLNPSAPFAALSLVDSPKPQLPVASMSRVNAEGVEGEVSHRRGHGSGLGFRFRG